MPLHLFTQQLEDQYLWSISNLLILFSPFLLGAAGLVGFGAAFYYLKQSDHELLLGNSKNTFSADFIQLFGTMLTFLSLVAILVASLVSISLILSAYNHEVLNTSLYDSQSWLISGFIAVIGSGVVSLLFRLEKRWRFNRGLVLSFATFSISFLFLIGITASQGVVIRWPLDSEEIASINPFIMIISMITTGFVFVIRGAKLRRFGLASRQ